MGILRLFVQVCVLAKLYEELLIDAESSPQRILLSIAHRNDRCPLVSYGLNYSLDQAILSHDVDAALALLAKLAPGGNGL